MEGRAAELRRRNEALERFVGGADVWEGYSDDDSDGEYFGNYKSEEEEEEFELILDGKLIWRDEPPVRPAPPELVAVPVSDPKGKIQTVTTTTTTSTLDIALGSNVEVNLKTGKVVGRYGVNEFLVEFSDGVEYVDLNARGNEWRLAGETQLGVRSEHELRGKGEGEGEGGGNKKSRKSTTATTTAATTATTTTTTATAKRKPWTKTVGFASLKASEQLGSRVTYLDHEGSKGTVSGISDVTWGGKGKVTGRGLTVKWDDHPIACTKTKFRPSELRLLNESGGSGGSGGSGSGSTPSTAKAMATDDDDDDDDYNPNDSNSSGSDSDDMLLSDLKPSGRPPSSSPLIPTVFTVGSRVIVIKSESSLGHKCKWPKGSKGTVTEVTPGGQRNVRVKFDEKNRFVQGSRRQGAVSEIWQHGRNLGVI